MTDLLIYEQGSGGEMLLRSNSIVTVDGFENEPYLAMFGGVPVEADWWGNDPIFNEEPMVSLTEQALSMNPLNSAGRIAIETAMLKDLQTVTSTVEGTTPTVVLMIKSDNRLEADIKINGRSWLLKWSPDAMYLNYKVPV